MKRMNVVLKRMGILIVALAVAHGALLLLSGLSLRRAQTRLSVAGRPMTAEEVIPAAVFASENAAPLYEAALALLNVEGRSEETGRGDTLQKWLFHAASAVWHDMDCLEKRQEFEDLWANEWTVQAMALVELAVERPESYFHLQYRQGLDMIHPHINGILGLNRVLTARALIEAKEENVDSSWSYIEQSIRLADAIRDEPTLLSALARIAMHIRSMETIRRVSDMSSPDPGTASRLAALIDGAAQIDPLIDAFDGERILMGEWVFRIMGMRWFQDEFSLVGDDGPVSSLAMRWQRILHAYRPIRQLDHAAFLRESLEQVRLLQHLDAEDFSDAEFTRSVEPRRFPWYATMTEILMPSGDVVVGRLAAFLAEARVTSVGLALIQYRNVYGEYPDSLDKLVPDFIHLIPIDPFTGQDLVYRPENAGFVLYSLGPHRDDQGGSAHTSDNQDSEIVWRASR